MRYKFVWYKVTILRYKITVVHFMRNKSKNVEIETYKVIVTYKGMSLMRVIHCFSCPPPSLVHDLHLFLAEVISNLSPVSFSPASLHSSVGKKGGLGGWYRHKHIPYFFPCEGSFQATWSSATFFLGHAHQRQANEWGETEREGEGFLLVFPGVYLTWLHLRFFSQVSNIHQSIRCPPPTEGLNGKLPWYDLLFCSQNMFTHTFIWILNGNMP